ncbi:hypothetical protein [Petropleomorpha daqingensis]|uniref:Uncharacterized protein n=1 Tax=Petropleomorpha daqingensis TaxID=2026353 RepID=A0A853CAD7_9ACTN|nr:hypothetical protein [Petropleomorpha daqingensis]NYJ04139.1 hypothetical protein [Petropleomorpha daqingensis]
MIRGVRAVVALLAVVLTAAGCGFVDAMAHPEEQTTQPSSAAPVTAAPTTAPPGPVTIVSTDLTGGGPGGLHLDVTVDPVRTGLVPPFPEFSDGCPVSGPSLQYVAVNFSLSGNPGDYWGLAAHLTVTPGAATPGDIGDVGVFFGPSPGHDVYCTDYPPLPTSDRFWEQGMQHVVTGYVVLDQAVTAATPQGRAEVFPTLQARIDHLRVKDGQTLVERELHVTAVRTGTQCPDDPDAFCLPL